MNFSIALTEFLPSNTNISMVISGDSNCVMNAGQFFIRDTAWTMQMLGFVEQGCQNICGCRDGNDQLLFNYFIWKNCTLSYRDSRMCQAIVQQSSFKDQLSCAEMSTYVQDYDAIARKGSLFRMHFAGQQSGKLELIRRFSELVAF